MLANYSFALHELGQQVCHHLISRHILNLHLITVHSALNKEANVDMARARACRPPSLHQRLCGEEALRVLSTRPAAMQRKEQLTRPGPSSGVRGPHAGAEEA